MVDVMDVTLEVQLVIGFNERAILQAASTKIEDPNLTTVGSISLAKREVEDFGYDGVLLDMPESDFLRHKQNLLSEMDEAIKAAQH